MITSLQERRQKVATPGWYLEGYSSEGSPWILPVDPLPFLIGRCQDSHLRLSSPWVSRRHAEIYSCQDELWIRECSSTNGIFINRQRLIGKSPLCAGDILHIGPYELGVGHAKTLSPAPPLPGVLTREPVLSAGLPGCFVDGEGEFDELQPRQAVIAYFQPIVRLNDHTFGGGAQIL